MMRLFYYRKNITNTALKIDIISADIDWHLLSITLTLQGLAWSVYDQCFTLLYAGNRKSSSDPQKLMEPISNTNFLQYLIWFNLISSMYTNHLKGNMHTSCGQFNGQFIGLYEIRRTWLLSSTNSQHSRHSCLWAINVADLQTQPNDKSGTTYGRNNHVFSNLIRSLLHAGFKLKLQFQLNPHQATLLS